MVTPAALRALADRIEREHPDDVDEAVADMIQQLQDWREQNGYISIGRLK